MTRRLPGGTVTLVLGDVEASTERWEASSDDMTAAMAALHATLDDLVGAHNGARPREQGEGDSFVVAFTKVADAVGFATALQEVSALPVRIGIHTGDVDVVDHGYAGPTIIRAARLRDAGHGGQVLLSNATAALVADAVDLEDLGRHQLKGLTRPEHVWQLPGDFPPLRLTDDAPTVPLRLTAFIGRGLELTQVGDLVKEPGCITITGAGGAGKTRLALQLVAQEDRAAWFVDLAAVDHDDGVDTAVADVVGARLAFGRSRRDAIASAIRDKDALLVLDNCEHLLPACGGLAADLLARCPSLSLLATSREPLGLDGEITYRLPSLAEAEAVDLFVERARRANPRFGLDDTTASTVADICARLDGMPLAIELAAARMRVFSPPQLRDALHDRFRLLTGGARTATPRQRTLEASVDWSYNLLLEPERILLRRLSVFVGGFTLPAAVAVTADGDLLDEHHVFDLLVQLVEKSLVSADERAPGRFVMLETIRVYAAARLVDAGEVQACSQRHYAHFLGQAGDAGRATTRTDDEFRDLVGADDANFRRALQWAADQPDSEPLMTLAALMADYWVHSSRGADGAHWISLALEHGTDAPASSRAVLLARLSQTHPDGWVVRGDLARKAIALAREVGDDELLMGCILDSHIAIANSSGPDRTLLDEAIAVARKTGNTRGLARGLFQSGFAIMRGLGTAEEAVPLLEDALQISQQHGYSWLGAMAEAWLGVNAVLSRNMAGTRRLERAVRSLRRSGEVFVQANTLAILAAAYSVEGNDEAADRTLAELDEIAADLADPVTIHFQHIGHGFVELFRGSTPKAIAALRAVTDSPLIVDNGMRGFLGMLALAEVVEGDSEAAKGHLARARALAAGVDAPGIGGSAVDLADALLALAEGDLDRAWEMTYGRREDHSPPDLCAALTGRVAARLGHHEEGIRLIAAARQVPSPLGSAVAFQPLWEVTIEEAMSLARAALGDARVDELWAEGESMTLDQAMALLRRGRGPRQRPILGWDSLTPTEAEVAALVAQGLSNKDVAAKLFMSEATVKTHLTRIYAKVGVKSRAQLAASRASATPS